MNRTDRLIIYGVPTLILAILIGYSCLAPSFFIDHLGNIPGLCVSGLSGFLLGCALGRLYTRCVTALLNRKKAS